MHLTASLRTVGGLALGCIAVSCLLWATGPATRAPRAAPTGLTGIVGPATVSSDAVARRNWLRPGTAWQWQLDGRAIDESVLDGVSNPQKMYDVDMETTGADVIARLRAKGIHVVCYLETGGWESYRSDAAQFPAAVLGNRVGGYPNERYLDIRRQDVLLPLMGARFDRAAAKGCNGIEPDLDDTYTVTTGFPLTMVDQLSYNRAVAQLAHDRGLSIGLKNGASADGSFERAMESFTDWALNESCNRFAECGGYAVYVQHGKPVFQVEYIDEGMSVAQFCPADNAAGFDGLLKQSSSSLSARPRTACRPGS
ncbi:MAG: endo alpha-1,4 polygalactosaminidase [Actinobacteria bacterium]|nr:endo alpha-1,4 polygalactosaminidase [Actinomycetota bacterium]